MNCWRNLILLRLSNSNPAAERVRELIDDTQLTRNSAYAGLMNAADTTVHSSRPG